MSDSPNPQPPHGLGVPPSNQPAGLPPPATPPNQAAGPTQPVGEVPIYDRGTTGAGRRTVVLAAAVALVFGLAGGFLAGRQTAPKGPATLADAVRLASQGKLPTGSFTPGQGGLGSLFRGQGQNGQNGNPFRGGHNGGGQNAQGQPGPFNRGIQATISSVAGDVATVQTPAGQVQVHIGADTRIQKSAAGSKADLKPGSRVLVTLDLSRSQGDGSVTAASILSEGTAS
jgi:hypothetical protein